MRRHRPRPGPSAALLAAALLLSACGDEDAATTDAATTDAASDATAAEDATDAEDTAADATEDPDTTEAPDAADDEDTTAPDDTAEADGPEANDDEGAAAGPSGTVTVDGASYTVDELRRCEPLDDATIERELELQAIGDHEGERVQIDVYVQTLAGTPFDDVSWSGPEGVFGGPDDAAVEIAGDQVSGTATLVDAMSQTETVSIEFVLPLPADEIACR